MLYDKEMLRPVICLVIAILSFITYLKDCYGSFVKKNVVKVNGSSMFALC